MAIKKSKEPTKRELNALETKRKIFNKSIELFRKYDFDTVTIGDITGELNLSKGTFYVHFPSKESILIEQFRQIDEHYLDVLKELPEDVSAIDTLFALMDAMCEYCEDVVGLALMQVVYANQVSPRKTSTILIGENRMIYRLLEDVYQKGLASGEFRTLPEGFSFSDIIMRFARALIYDWCMTDGGFDLIQEGKEHFHLLLKLFV